MDGNALGRKINCVIAPIMKANGFIRKGSKWWKRTETVTFFVGRKVIQTYPPSIDRTPSYSIAVHLAACLRCIPSKRIRAWDEFLPPNEGDCHMSKTLRNTAGQPDEYGYEWTVGEASTNLEEVLIDVEKAISTVAIPWFEQLSDLENVFAMMQEWDARRDFYNWSLNLGTPQYLAGYVALELGKKSMALDYLEREIEFYGDPFWKTMNRNPTDSDVIADVERLKQELGHS
ncbi:MAG: DUF4304 domain-containing protein [Candidatus Melainabacteria bacterium]|nr:DUF4304 domain-containing protein [Candidatus Melainabacteria bacterium]